MIVFGAKDLEERVAREISVRHGYPVATATYDGRPVTSATAYQANGFIVNHGKARLKMDCIIFECSPGAAIGLNVIAKCDHHNPGDYGFALGPEKFYEASSLGQLMKLLGITTHYPANVIAAADHCLADAYQGKCLGVKPDDVLRLRLPELMLREGYKSITLAQDHIANTRLELRQHSKKILIGHYEVADLRDFGQTPFLTEAALIEGLAYLAKNDNRFSNKINISAPKEVIETFLGEAVIHNGELSYPNGWAAKNAFTKAYGNPNHGFAKAYE